MRKFTISTEYYGFFFQLFFKTPFTKKDIYVIIIVYEKNANSSSVTPSDTLCFTDSPFTKDYTYDMTTIYKYNVRK